jgi:hypothetical protein
MNVTWLGEYVRVRDFFPLEGLSGSAGLYARTRFYRKSVIYNEKPEFRARRVRHNRCYGYREMCGVVGIDAERNKDFFAHFRH